MLAIKFALLCCLIIPSLSVKGVDVSQPFSTTVYQCMKQNGMTYVIIRGYCSFGGVDSHAVTGLQNAKAAGLITDVYFFPCTGKKSPATQVAEMFAAIPSNLYGMIWIDVETNTSPGCGWEQHSHEDNCKFLIELINAIKSHGKVPAIYASAYMWQNIMGSRTACPAAASQQLWYPHYDGNPSFADFSAFGGWTKPTIKQYTGTSSFCGGSVDHDYYP